MPRLSILLPWQGPTETFEATLVSVLSNRPPDCQVIVVHGGQYDDPYELRREVLLVEHDDDARLCDLLQRGLEVSSGEVVHVLACGVEVHEGWTDSVWSHFDDPRVGSVCPLVVDRASSERLLAAGVKVSHGGARQLIAAGRPLADAPEDHGWGPSLLAGFYRRQQLVDLGGFSSHLGELADADLAGSLRGAGFRSVVDRGCVLAGCLSGSEPIRAAQRARQKERLFWRQAPAMGWGRALLCHGGHLLLQLASASLRGRALAELQGRAGALLELPRLLRHHRRVRQCGYEPEPASISMNQRRPRAGQARPQRRAA